MLPLCPNCDSQLPEWFIRAGRSQNPCPVCYVDVVVEIFPAMFQPPAAIEPARLARDENEASCYEHPTKRAVSVCYGCGRFLCALCEVELDGQMWCPACLNLGNPRGGLATLDTQRTLYDSISLAIATWPVLFFYPLFVSPPIAIYLAIKHWKTRSSIIPRNKWRFVVALLLAGLELAFVAVLVFFMVVAFQRGLVRNPPR